MVDCVDKGTELRLNKKRPRKFVNIFLIKYLLIIIFLFL